MDVFTEGAFGYDEDLVIGVPVTCANGDFQIVDLEIDAASRLKIDVSIAELAGERNAIYRPSAL